LSLKDFEWTAITKLIVIRQYSVGYSEENISVGHLGWSNWNPFPYFIIESLYLCTHWKLVGEIGLRRG